MVIGKTVFYTGLFLQSTLSGAFSPYVTRRFCVPQSTHQRNLFHNEQQPDDSGDDSSTSYHTTQSHHANDRENWRNGAERILKSLFVSTFITGALLFTSQPSHNEMMQYSSKKNHRHLIHNIFEVQPAYATTKVEEDVDVSSSTTVLDEVWTLVNKYYIDQTFHNQDWSNIRNQYDSRLPINDKDNSYSDEEAMKLASAMVATLGDKYSRILDRESYARIQKFDLIGIGATLMPNKEKRIMVGAPPVVGSEAEKGGLKYGDYITSVNDISTSGLTAFEIIDQISEKDSPIVKMTVVTENPGKDDYIRDVTMARAFAEVKNPVSFKVSEKRSDGTTVGYIRISEFNSLVKSKVEEALQSLEKDGCNAYVLDVRSNPGGAFQSAVELAGLFMEDKIATYVVDGSSQSQMPLKTTKDKVVISNNDPVVIWIDGGSASATEVFAGALHDQCRAVVVGSNSFGKGLIQAVYGLKNRSGLVLTVAKYVTPNGTNIQGSGIVPDVNMKLPFLLVPGLSSDTSKMNFNEIRGKLQPSMCQLAPRDV